VGAETKVVKNYWTAAWRWVVFGLSFSSIACLLAEFYGLCPMRIFTLAIFLPAMFALAALAALDWTRGDGELARAVWIGAAGGLAAAVAYDVFRLPFVFARELGVAGFIPPLQLFKVFPRFGAMILGEALDQPTYSWQATVLGWGYHFSNGATFGVMYLSMVGKATRRHWAWAVLMAVAIELGMLASPYAQVFNIPITTRFVIVTLAAHAIFGACLGLASKRIEQVLEVTRAQASGAGHTVPGPN
jgi:hypothetical protein